MFMAFRCASLEIITSYCLDRSFNSLDVPKFEHPFLISLQRAIPFFWVLKYVPFLNSVLVNPPEWIYSIGLLDRGIFNFRRLVADDIDRILAKPDVLHESEQETIYHHLLAVSQTEDGLIAREDLFQEVLAATLAGSDTVGNTCTTGFFHILSNPEVLRKLVAELDHAWPDMNSQLDFQTKEKLPYLVCGVDGCSQF